MRKLMKTTGCLLSKRRFHWKGHDEKVRIPEEDPLSYVASYRENCSFNYEDEICGREDRYVMPDEDELEERDVAVAPEEEPDDYVACYTGSEDEPTPLEEALGCQGVSIIDSADKMSMVDHELNLFDSGAEEGSLSRILEDIGTNILVAAAYADENDVGVVVSVEGNSDAKDFGAMVEDIMGAKSPFEIQEVLGIYGDMPCAKELAKFCEDRLAALKLARKAG